MSVGIQFHAAPLVALINGLLDLLPGSAVFIASAVEVVHMACHETKRTSQNITIFILNLFSPQPETFVTLDTSATKLKH